MVTRWPWPLCPPSPAIPPCQARPGHPWPRITILAWRHSSRVTCHNAQICSAAVATCHVSRCWLLRPLPGPDPPDPSPPRSERVSVRIVRNRDQSSFTSAPRSPRVHNTEIATKFRTLNTSTYTGISQTWFFPFLHFTHHEYKSTILLQCGCMEMLHAPAPQIPQPRHWITAQRKVPRLI